MSTVTDAELEAVGRCRGLRRLDMSGCTHVTDEGRGAGGAERRRLLAVLLLQAGRTMLGALLDPCAARWPASTAAGPLVLPQAWRTWRHCTA